MPDDDADDDLQAVLKNMQEISIKNKAEPDLSYEEVYPCLARNEFKFGKLVFSSKFDSGNMLKVTKIKAWEYDIESCLDCEGTANVTTYSSWFHFSISGAEAGEEITIRIVNLNKHPGLYDNDMRPVFKSYPSQRKWERIRSILKHQVVDKRSVIRFTHKFQRSNERVHFAFCYPYTYTELQRKLTDMENKYSGDNESIYYHRELLTRSLDKRRIDLITISSVDGITDQREDFIPLLFPTKSERALRFQNKRVVFISARIHPGETPASHVLDGILEFLQRRDDPRATALRQEFVFKIIPMLNPDGVARGHYRTDTNGLNLNRVYQNPSFEAHPSVYAAKQVVLYLHAKNDLVMYLDLHAHASKRGCFIYGNKLDSVQDQVSTQLYPKLVGLNSCYFEYDQCNFTEKNMKSKDLRDKGVSKEGSGRVALYRETKMVHVYTMECNYNMGRHARGTPNAGGSHSGRASPGVTKRSYVPKYTAENWQDVGKGLAIAILDLYQMNPWSRVEQSEFRSHSGLRKAIEASVIKSQVASAAADESKRRNIGRKQGSKALLVQQKRNSRRKLPGKNQVLFPDNSQFN